MDSGLLVMRLPVKKIREVLMVCLRYTGEEELDSLPSMIGAVVRTQR